MTTCVSCQEPGWSFLEAGTPGRQSLLGAVNKTDRSPAPPELVFWRGSPTFQLAGSRASTGLVLKKYVSIFGLCTLEVLAPAQAPP